MTPGSTVRTPVIKTPATTDPGPSAVWYSVSVPQVARSPPRRDSCGRKYHMDIKICYQSIPGSGHHETNWHPFLIQTHWVIDVTVTVNNLVLSWQTAFKDLCRMPIGKALVLSPTESLDTAWTNGGFLKSGDSQSPSYHPILMGYSSIFHYFFRIQR